MALVEAHFYTNAVPTGLKRFLKFSRFPRSIRFGFLTEPNFDRKLWIPQTSLEPRRVYSLGHFFSIFVEKRYLFGFLTEPNFDRKLWILQTSLEPRRVYSLGYFFSIFVEKRYLANLSPVGAASV